MNLYFLESGIIIKPFNVKVSEVLIQNTKLADWQKEAVSKLKVDNCKTVNSIDEIVDSEELILINDNIFFTHEFIQIFLSKARSMRKPCQCTVNAEMYNPQANMEIYKAGKDYEAIGIYYYPGGIQPQTRVETCCMPDLIDVSLEYNSIPPHLLNQSMVSYICSKKIAVEIGNWADLLNANLYANRKILADIGKSRLSILKGIVKTLSTNKYKILGANTKIGRNCDIHPTAVIEGCIIGDNVTIMANVHLVATTVGDNTNITSNSVIQFSTIGESCLIIGATIMYSTIHNETFVGRNVLINSLIGERVQLSVNITISDHKIGGAKIPIKMGRKSIPTRYKWLGACIGHDCKIGADVKLMEGLTVPNGLQIHVGDHLSYIADNMPAQTPLIVQDKALRYIPILKK